MPLGPGMYPQARGMVPRGQGAANRGLGVRMGLYSTATTKSTPPQQHAVARGREQWAQGLKARQGLLRSRTCPVVGGTDSHVALADRNKFTPSQHLHMPYYALANVQ